MNPEGQIDIKLKILPSGKKEALIVNNRPVHAAQLLVGKSIDEALMIIPLLYHVCGKAQGLASVTALQSALDKPSDETTLLSRLLLADIELIREHLLRIFMNWPDLLETAGETFNHEDQMPRFMKFLSVFQIALFGDVKPFSNDAVATPKIDDLNEAFSDLDEFLTANIFGCSPEIWAKAKSRDVILYWMKDNKGLAARCCSLILENGWAKEGHAQTRFLPQLTHEDCAKLLFPDLYADPTQDKTVSGNFDDQATGDLISAPTWLGEPAETSALSRYHQHPLLQMLMEQCGNGLLTRQFSRLVELAMVFIRVKQNLSVVLSQSSMQKSNIKPKDSVAPSFGIGMVEAARGLLIHGVQIEGDLIKDYKILAPTEWNFHNEGALSNALCHINGTDPDHIKMIADMLIPAIDPCTATSLEVCHA